MEKSTQKLDSGNGRQGPMSGTGAPRCDFSNNLHTSGQRLTTKAFLLFFLSVTPLAGAEPSRGLPSISCVKLHTLQYMEIAFTSQGSSMPFSTLWHSSTAKSVEKVIINPLITETQWEQSCQRCRKHQKGSQHKAGESREALLKSNAITVGRFLQIHPESKKTSEEMHPASLW